MAAGLVCINHIYSLYLQHPFPQCLQPAPPPGLLPWAMAPPLSTLHPWLKSETKGLGLFLSLLPNSRGCLMLLPELLTSFTVPLGSLSPGCLHSVPGAGVWPPDGTRNPGLASHVSPDGHKRDHSAMQI